MSDREPLPGTIDRLAEAYSRERVRVAELEADNALLKSGANRMLNDMTELILALKAIANAFPASSYTESKLQDLAQAALRKVGAL